MLTHAYMFLHNFFSHDSLAEFNAEPFGSIWRIRLGRIFVPAYRAVTRTPLTLPWLIGFLSLLWIGIAVYFTVKLFSIQSKTLCAMIAGIFTANITVTATAATYLHDLDCNMLALMLAVIAAYLWDNYKYGFFAGMAAIGFSIGLYQSYLSTTLTLILLVLIMDLLNEKKFDTIIQKTGTAILMVIGGGFFYFICLKCILAMTQISLISGNYNSLDTALSMSLPRILYSACTAYFSVLYNILFPASAYPRLLVLLLHCFSIALAGCLVLSEVFSKRMMLKAKLLTLCLIAMLPLAMNTSHILTAGMSHDLMHFAIWLVYLFILLISHWYIHRESRGSKLPKWSYHVLLLLIFAILWGNVQTANAAYLKKNIEHEANLSMFTRVLYRMEETKGYTPGKTPVIFVGQPKQLLTTMNGFEKYYGITGSWNSYVLNSESRNRYLFYFEYVLDSPILLAEPEVWDSIKSYDTVIEMPCYPDSGCMKTIDGILVVKLGDV